MVATEPYAPLSAAPELAPIIDRCLAKNIDWRYQDIGELAFALQPYASDAERARRQVARVWRILGKPLPDVLDLTPTPLPMPLGRRSSSDAIQLPFGLRSSSDSISSPSNLIVAQTPVPTPSRPPAQRPWKLLVVLVALFAVGIVAGVWAMTSATDKQAPTRSAHDDSVTPRRPGRCRGRRRSDARCRRRQRCGRERCDKWQRGCER